MTDSSCAAILRSFLQPSRSQRREGTDPGTRSRIREQQAELISSVIALLVDDFWVRGKRKSRVPPRVSGFPGPGGHSAPSED